METITINVARTDVYSEVAKATDYTGSKLIDGDITARDRILASDDDLETLWRFWEESVMVLSENFKEMLVSSQTVSGNNQAIYRAVFEVSKSFDTVLTVSVQSAIRSYFIASIIAQWFKFANKGEAADYFAQAAEMLKGAERLLYSRKRPQRPNDETEKPDEAEKPGDTESQ